jgi:hypothetical protein
MYLAWLSCRVPSKATQNEKALFIKDNSFKPGARLEKSSGISRLRTEDGKHFVSDDRCIDEIFGATALIIYNFSSVLLCNNFTGSVGQADTFCDA